MSERGVSVGLARPLARALLVAGALAFGLPSPAGASGAAPVPASTCFSHAYACTIDGYNAVTMNDNWAAKYYGPGALGGIGDPPHNCTLFAAWMLARDGVPDPGRTWGNAWQWGYTLSPDVSAVATVGSIAWYGPGRLANASGHVAYVARVNQRAGLVFLVSDNYGGGWAGSTSSGWTPISAPSGYIHVRSPALARHHPRPTTPTTVPATTPSAPEGPAVVGPSSR